MLLVGDSDLGGGKNLTLRKFFELIHTEAY